MACYLTIWGKFNPEAVTQNLDVPVQSCWREGELSTRGRINEDSGIQLRVSCTGLHDYKKLFSEAEEFLRAHQEAIASLTRREDTLESVLDFGMAQAPHPAYYRRIPTSLVKVAADLRLAIELSFYACNDDASAPAQ